MFALGKLFGQKEDLVDRIRTILVGYSSKSSIFKGKILE
jgi:hypothetical protein